MLKPLKTKGYAASRTLCQLHFSTSWKWKDLKTWVQSGDTQRMMRTAHQTTLKNQANNCNLPRLITSHFQSQREQKLSQSSLDEKLKASLFQNRDIQVREDSPSYETIEEEAQLLGLTVSEFMSTSNLLLRKEQARNTIEERIASKDYPVSLKKRFQEFSLDSIATILSSHIEIGGMSDGALSKHAHRNLTEAANLTGTLTNAGEGGVERDRHRTIENPLIIQCASGRFGFDLTAMVECDEVQIKLAQGAKPGEGGHLPGSKVTVRIAKIRRAAKSTTLISPQPMHDLYSIEDMFLLIHAIKSVKPGIRVSVKLASDPDVAITALGAVKAGADRITIAGHTGGTGAAKISSIFNTGLPWEWGVATTHQILSKYGLRSKIQLVASGSIVNGADIVDAVLLGADKVEIGTAALVSLGCIMLRKCHSPRTVTSSSFIVPLASLKKYPESEVKALSQMIYVIPSQQLSFTNVYLKDALCEAGYVEAASGAVSLDYQEIEAKSQDIIKDSLVALEESLIELTRQVLLTATGGCTVGVNTQDPLYAKKYTGQVSSAVDFLLMLAVGTLRHMLENCAGETNLHSLQGRARDYLSSTGFFEDVELLLGSPCQIKKADGYIDSLLDIPSSKDVYVIEAIKGHMKRITQGQVPADSLLRIEDVSCLNEKDVSFGAAISGFCEYHSVEFPVEIVFTEARQVGPQNFGCFLRKNIKLIIEGSCNDHLGKGLSGGSIVVRRRRRKEDEEEERKVIVGNSIGFGATEGEIFIDGSVGTRAFVRNSGVNAVVTEDAHDHFCEFMTRGNVALLGKIGRNHAAGMTGGLLFLDATVNSQIVKSKRFNDLRVNPAELGIFRDLLERCCKATGSLKVKGLLVNWEETVRRFKFFSPLHVNVLLEKKFTDENVVEDVPFIVLFAGENGVGETLGRLENAVPRKTKLLLNFSNAVGADFCAYTPKSVAVKFKGSKTGAFTAYASKSQIVLVEEEESRSAMTDRCFTGKYSFFRATGDVFVRSVSPLGHHALNEFAGTAVVVNAGEDACLKLRSTSKVIVLESVGRNFAQQAHKDSLIVIPKTSDSEHKMHCLTDDQVAWVHETLQEYMHLTGGEVPEKRAIATTFGRLAVKEEEVKRSPVRVEEKKDLIQRQIAAGWSEESEKWIESLGKTGADEMTYSMGDQQDLTDRFLKKRGSDQGAGGESPNFYGVFRQPFAQETRPPIDADTEGSFISTDIYLRQHKEKTRSSDNPQTFFKFTNPIISKSHLVKIQQVLKPIVIHLKQVHLFREEGGSKASKLLP